MIGFSYPSYLLAADDHGDTLIDATLISVNSTTNGNIDSSDDVDLFRLNLDKFGKLVVWTSSKLWTEGRLLDDRGNVRATDRFSGPGLNFRIEEDVAPGIWYVEVSGYWDDDIGEYVLHVEFEVNNEILPAALPRTPYLGDFNGDGYQDILLRHLDGRWFYYAMMGREVLKDASGFVAITRDLSYGVAGIGDFNGDGKDDILVRHINGEWHYHLMDGRQFLGDIQQHPQIPTDINYQLVGIGDFSFFGETDDVLLRNRLDGTWVLVEMRGTEEPWVDDFSINRRLSQSLEYRVAGVGDFDANGNDDILLRHTDGSWYLYLLDRFNNVDSEGSVSLESDLSFRFVGIADFDGDNYDDILLRHEDGHWLFYPMNDGRPHQEGIGPADITGDSEITVVAIGDLNKDSKADVLLRDSNGTWYYHAMNGRASIIEESGVLSSITSDLNWIVPKLTIRATIGGSLNVSEGQILDGDTGDPLDPHEPNDSVEQAQSVRIPSSIAGYLISGIDDSDYYAIRLPLRAAKTRISLVIADSDNADFDLHLADENGTVVSESMGLENLEVIETNKSGRHIVVVSALNGSSNYTLSISTQLIDSQEKRKTYAVSRDGRFVLDELLVTPYELRRSIDRVIESTGFKLRDSFVTGIGDSLIQIEESRISQQSVLAHPILSGLAYADANLAARGSLLRLRKHLLESGDFKEVELNHLYESNIEPNDPHYRFQWHYPQINLPSAWDYTTGDDDIVIAVIDSGILPQHPDIAPQLWYVEGEIMGYDFVRDLSSASDGDGLDDDPTDTGDAFHGTHVAGTISASTNDQTGAGGVSWKSKILPVRVLGSDGSGAVNDIIEGILYAAGLNNVSGIVPPRRADVINLSLGFPNEHCLPTLGPSSRVKSAIESAIRSGVVVVKSAGNDSCRFADPWSKIDGVIVVGATDYRNRKTPYSNFGPFLDVVAPGGDTSVDLNADGYVDGVLSTDGRREGTSLSYISSFKAGTSMSAPHISGVVSLMLALNPDLTPSDINSLINGTHRSADSGSITLDLGSRGRDNDFGHGLIDAVRAVQVARSLDNGRVDPPSSPILSLTPLHLSFGLVEDTLRVIAQNLGANDLTITNIEADVSWVSVVNQYPFLIFSVDRNGLENGTHLGEVAIHSNGGTVNVSLSIQVENENIAADIGTVYAQLVDADSDVPQGWATTNVRGGYTFIIPAVEGRRYFVYAGTDRDGDGHICDPGEACGSYPLRDDPRIIEVNGDVKIEFTVSIDLFARVASQSAGSRYIPTIGFPIDETVGVEAPN